MLNLLLFIAVIPPISMAHDSVQDVEAQIQQNERYAQLTNRPAPGFDLQDVDGRKISLQDFQGRVVILNFIYARCKEVCPVHSALIAGVQRQIAVARLADLIQFVSIATDTENAVETASTMREHGSNYGLDLANWVFLHGGVGNENAGIQVAESYGIKFTPTGNGEQSHGIMTLLIDGSGVVRAVYHGLKFNPVNLTLHAAALANGEHHGGGAEKNAGTATLMQRFTSLAREDGLSFALGLLAGLIFLFVAYISYRKYAARRGVRISGLR